MVRTDTSPAITHRQGAAHAWRWLRAGLGALALAAAAPGWAQTAITAITTSQEKGRDVVRIEFNHDTYVAPTSFKLENPPRFIIDLPGIEIGEANRNIRLQEGNVRAIDLAAGPNRTRIVLDLSVPANLYTNQEQNFVELTLEPAVARDPDAIQVVAAPAAQPAPSEAPVPSAAAEIQATHTETAAAPVAPPTAPAPDRAPAVAEQITPAPAAAATDDTWPPASIAEPAPAPAAMPSSATAAPPAPVAAAPAPAPANRVARRPAPRAAAPQRANVTLDFVNAEIEAVARTMATITGNNVVVDPRVRGTMTLTSTTPVTPQGALSLFGSQLRTQGFSLVEADGIYLVLPEAEAKLHGGRVSAGPVRGGGQIQTHIFRLLHENANNLVPILRPLISPNNTINVDPGANALVITDYGDNLARLASIIAALDVSQATRVEIIALHNTVALDLAPLVASLLDFGAGGATAPAAQARDAAPGAAPAAITAGAGGAKAALIPEPNSNSIIVRASNPARLAEAVALIRQLDQPPSTWDGNEKGNIHVVYLKNADATKLAVTLRAALAALPGNSSQSGGGGGGASSAPVTQGQTLMRAVIGGGGSSLETGPTIDSASGNQPSTGGQVQADPSTNSLIISAPEPVYRQLRAVIDQLDQRRAQVFVESLIAEVRTDKMAEFGVQWQGVLGRNGDRNVGVIGTNYGTLGNILAVAPGINDLITNEKFPDSLPVQQGLNLGLAHRFGAGYLLSALANFIQTSGTGNVLSTPTLLTLDNEEARIVVGQNVPFVTGSYANTGGIGNIVTPFQTIERKDVGLTLRVRPQISQDGTIKMVIYQETSNVVPGSVNSAQGLITNKRAIESSVLVDDGQIVVLGGLMEDQYTSGDDRVPVLGDIPLLGNLFRNENRNHVKTNLMVFLRPVIVRDAAATENFSLSRYEYLRAAQMANQPRPSSILQINRAPVMPPAVPQHADLTQVPLQPKPLIELPASGE